MALLFNKTLIFPRTKHAHYTPLATHSPTRDCETGSLEDNFAENTMNEKNTRHQEPSVAVRINPRIISDATIGLSDGLTVPFALTAGLSALGDTHFVIYAGLAELIAGGISMGLGGYLGAKGESDAYCAALSEARSIVATDPDRAKHLAVNAFDRYDLSTQTLNCMVTSLLSEPPQMVDFLMRFHYQLSEMDYASSRPYTCGLTISSGYIFGGLIPLLPYLVISSVDRAFFSSVCLMALALFAFGWAKTSLVGESSQWVCFRNGLQMMVLGASAAGAAMVCVKTVGS